MAPMMFGFNHHGMTSMGYDCARSVPEVFLHGFPVEVFPALRYIIDDLFWDVGVDHRDLGSAFARAIGESKLKINNALRTLEPTAKGTKLTSTMDYELPYSILGKLVDKLRVSKDVEKTMERTLRDTKKALEA
jgi:hypothetical protein